MSKIVFGIIKKAKDLVQTKEGRDYLTSTHFWGPVSNWGIPMAAIRDIYNEPKYISGSMTTALTLYSAIFMRFALKVHPRNLLLFCMHLINCSAQSIQLIRYLNYERSLTAK